ncbi:MAG: phenylacetate-CoA oxygenase subunit PaaC [Acetobacteraceae bacterium]|nr:phenylacetate-CoA oxygenase subunit PaaC [Acetobacteraceae bacterium]
MAPTSITTTSITLGETPRIRALLARADDALVLGHRLSEWTGRAPLLEEELALANIALDLIGQARALYTATGQDEDRLAYLRDAWQYRNALVMELPNGDFAFTISRLFLVSAASDRYWRAAMTATDPDLAAIAAKAEKETTYHLRHAAEWLIRLGDGTADSHRRTQAALDALWPYTGELFEPDGLGPEIARADWETTVAPVIARATLACPADGWMQSGGRRGRHTEHLGHLLAEMQVLPRTYPGATW